MDRLLPGSASGRVALLLLIGVGLLVLGFVVGWWRATVHATDRIEEELTACEPCPIPDYRCATPDQVYRAATSVMWPCGKPGIADPAAGWWPDGAWQQCKQLAEERETEEAGP